MFTACCILCLCYSQFYPLPSDFLHWHRCNHIDGLVQERRNSITSPMCFLHKPINMTVQVPVKQPWKISLHPLLLFIRTHDISTTKLEQLECLRSVDTPCRLMITHTIESCWIPSQTRLNDLEDIGQGQRSSNATHLLMLVIICTKYGKNPSRTVDATERTWFSRSRPNDLENIGQGQRSLHGTHPLMLMMICANYGKNASRIVDFFSRWKPKN